MCAIVGTGRGLAIRTFVYVSILISLVRRISLFR